MESASAKTFQELGVWQKAHQFVLAVYHYSDYFPQKEVYSLTSQLRRAAVSIPASIAEAFKTTEQSDKARCLNVAQGSVEARLYYLILATDLGYGDNQQLLPQLEEVGRLLERYAVVMLDTEF
ncbi:MAG TPA: four helix bundle protein [Pyrinomonadaceae bacterium]